MVVNAVTVNGDPAPEADLVTPALLDVQVAVYPVIGDPPLLAGAVNATTIWPTPGVAPVTDGAPGAPAVTTARDGADAGPIPTRFLATTVHV